MSEQSTDLQNRVALVTGASRRIGAEISRTLHQAGMKLCIHYRFSSAHAEQLVSDLNTIREGSAVKVQMDLQQTERLPELVAEATSQWGRLDLLVNNASTFYPTPVGEITLENWDDLVGSNMKAPLFLSQAAAPELAKHQGNIINIIDIHSERPRRKHTVYSMAKSGLLGMTRSLAMELAPDIRVNGVAPGAILWPEDESEQAKTQHLDIIERTALKHSGNPTDIAKAVLFLVKDAPYITGHMLPVDGGRLINI